MPDIGFEEVDPLDLMTFGKAQHLAAKRSQAAVEGIQIVDQEFDLGRVELYAFDFRGQLFAQCFVFLFLGRGVIVTCAQNINAFSLKLLELS